MLAQLGILVAFILYDSRRLFPPHRLGFTLPPRDDIRPIIAQSSGYFGQVVPVMMFTAVPVLFLQSQGLAAGVLASFLLVRTLANLARTPLQAFGIVIGQEFGRRIALNDRPGAFAVLDAGAHFFSVLSGLAFGIVTVAGSIIIHIWAGSASVYSLPLAIAALFPMLIGAVSILGHNILVASQMPFAAMLGRWVQVALTLIAYWLLPVDDLALRVMIALSVGELLGFAPVAYAAVERMVPDAAVSFHLRHIARTLFSAVFAAGLSAALIAMIPPERLLTQLVILALIGSVALIWVAFVGVSKATRMRLIDNLRPHGQSPAP
jgi:hypothetical protein